MVGGTWEWSKIPNHSSLQGFTKMFESSMRIRKIKEYSCKLYLYCFKMISLVILSRV